MGTVTTVGMAWNGPVCSTCGKGYTGEHTCTPADLLRRASELLDLAQKLTEKGDPAKKILEKVRDLDGEIVIHLDAETIVRAIKGRNRRKGLGSAGI